MTILGIAFPFGKSAFSLPARAEDDDVIAHNIMRTMLTRRGSRVMRPSTGSNIYDFVFESVGPVLAARIDDEVRAALGDGEPRSQVLAVNVNRRFIPALEQEELVVDITYRVLADIKKISVVIPRTL
jgi:phage baseplate assembly protein W